MERFKVSGQELRDFYKTETQLGRVFMDIERELKQSNQVVCQFIVNGLELREADEPRFSGISLQEVDTLEYLAEESGTLMDSVLNSWIEALPELIVQTDELAVRLRENERIGTYKAIHDLMDNCKYLVESMMSLQTIVGDKHSAVAQNWNKAESDIHKAVKQSIIALEKKDFVQLADILEYDLIQALQTWLECLIQLGDMFDINDGENSISEQTRSYSSGWRRCAH